MGGGGGAEAKAGVCGGGSGPPYSFLPPHLAILLLMGIFWKRLDFRYAATFSSAYGTQRGGGEGGGGTSPPPPQPPPPNRGRPPPALTPKRSMKLPRLP